MNQRTAKLIKKYCHETQTDYREIKKKWSQMNAADRTAQRSRMKGALKGSEE